MDRSGTTHPFDQDLSLARVAPLRFRGNVTDNWSINGIPNGGYLMALLTGQDYYMNIAIAWALISFVGTLALAKYLEGRRYDA